MKNLLLCGVLLLAPASVEAAELLIFTAAWCAPCQRLKEDLAATPEIVADYELGFVDFDREKELVRAYNVKTVPTFFILERGQVVRQQDGYRGPEQLKRWLRKNK